jgi:hypothetical protein
MLSPLERMMRKPHVDWIEVRIAFEIENAPVTEIARRYCVSRQAIHRHIRAENWQRSLRDMVKRRAQTMVASGDYTPMTARDAIALIDSESTRLAEVLQQHRRDWADVAMIEQRAQELHRQGDPLASKMAELARLGGRTVAVIHDGERVAFNLDDAAEEVSDIELEAAIDGALK